MNSRKNDDKIGSSGRRKFGGWRFSSPKVVAACQYDASAAVVAGTPHRTTTSHALNTSTSIMIEKTYDMILKEHESRIRERVSNISNDMIVRFLRRSLFQALCNEELMVAHSCYVATRDDFQQHFLTIMQQKFLHHRLQREVEEEEERQKQDVKQSRNRHSVRSHLKRKGAVVESPCSVIPSSFVENTNLTTDTTSSTAGVELDHGTTNIVAENIHSRGLLQQTMDVCQPFTMDDYLDPYRGPYRPMDNEDDDNDDDTAEDGDIEDGTGNVVDPINTLVDEILLISSLSGNALTEKSPSFSSSSSIMARASFRKSRRRMNDIDMSQRSDVAIADTLMMWPFRHQNVILADPLIVTTPLHEVARLGHVELFKCMLQPRYGQKKIDLDVRNGCGRTVLHNVAGGLVNNGSDEYENARIGTSMDVDTGDVEQDVGIGALQNPISNNVDGNDTTNHTTTGHSTNNELSASQLISRMMNRSGRWLSSRNINSKINDNEVSSIAAQLDSKSLPRFGKVSIDGIGANIPLARIDRMETIHIILSWRNELATSTTLCDTDDEVLTDYEDVTPLDVSVGGGDIYGTCSDDGHVSTNAVDVALNRTALHYAAELGRTDICEAILASFYGTMLTIIDNAGRTPCELAALYGHAELAAYLEARSLLYVDPYGTEEELLSTISMAEMNHNDVAYYRHNLVAPFCCFESISRSSADQQRKILMQEAVEQIDRLVAEFYRKKQQRIFQKQNLGTANNVDPPGRTENTISDVPETDDNAATVHAQSAEMVHERNAFFDVVYDVDDPPGIIERSQPSTNVEICNTAAEIGIHEGHVEKLLSYHKWLLSDMIAALRQSPFGAFNKACVPIPQHVKLSWNGAKSDESTQHFTCLICCDDFNSNSDKWKQMSGCDHGFCTDCLADYITDMTESSNTGFVIECPHHDCSALMPTTLINEVVQPSSDVYDRLRRSAIDAFVVSAQDYTYCPYPGCADTKVIHVLYPKFANPADVGVLRLIGGVCTNVHNVPSESSACEMVRSDDVPAIFSYESVPDERHYDLLDMIQPKLAHRFCFICAEKRIHWPITCSQLQEWRTIVVEQVGERSISNESCSASNFDDVAQNIWMKVNTRPCPKCNAPIQKDEGCNHITCRNPYCKHQFCWICRADWATHNTATGGNYRCNRWVEQTEHNIYDGETTIDADTIARVLAEEETDPSLMAETYGTARHESRVSKKRSLETARFLHHYERWCGHADSALLEHKMRLNLCGRLAPVVRKAIEYDGGIHIFDGKGISFIHAAFSELLECRSMLQHTYVFAFMNYKSNILSRQQSNEKFVFERIQSELELLTEQISDIVARTHIRASETQIVFLTKVAAGKRKEFTNFMIDLLRRVDIDKNTKLNSNQVNLPGHRPTNVRSTDFGSDDEEESEANAEAIRRSLVTYEAATNRQFHYNIDDDVIELQDWACTGCTYMNAGTVRRCDMCDTRRV